MKRKTRYTTVTLRKGAVWRNAKASWDRNVVRCRLAASWGFSLLNGRALLKPTKEITKIATGNTIAVSFAISAARQASAEEKIHATKTRATPIRAAGEWPEDLPREGFRDCFWNFPA